ncbi:MAG: hypothetical protein V2A74_04030 [bacterium]
MTTVKVKYAKPDSDKPGSATAQAHNGVHRASSKGIHGITTEDEPDIDDVNADFVPQKIISRAAPATSSLNIPVDF